MAYPSLLRANYNHKSSLADGFCYEWHVCLFVYVCTQSGGDLNAKDGDGYTPLSILNEDRERFKSSLGK